jgi:ribosomal protein L21
MADDQYRVLVQQMTEERAKDAGIADASKAFEMVVNTLLMSPYDLSVDEIDAGNTDGGGDGQVDAMYVLVNGHAMTEEDMENKTIAEKGPLEIEIILIQSKYTNSFEENPLKSVRSTVADLLDLSKDYSALNFAEYNSDIQTQFSIARYAIMASSGRAATIRATMYYASKGDDANIHASVLATAETLRKELAARSTTAEAEIKFLSARALIEASRRPQTNIRNLGFQESLSHDGLSIACLVTVGSLMTFLSDANGNIVRALFDANVRDFLGATDVNDAILQTLESLGDEDFWWFNNGITIVAENVDPKGKILALTDPLLVNGLQTSNVTHAFMSSEKIEQAVKDHIKDKRVLVRVIIPPSDSIRDTIIRATNSQTHIPKPYLRGMDRIHRNIEDHLRQMGIYYERRKNQYRNQGRARSTIVTLTEMAQSLVSALLFKGGDARGRPNSLLKLDDEYGQLFSEAYPLGTFAKIIQVKRAIMTELIKLHPARGSAFRNNIVWHVLAYISGCRFHSTKHAAEHWAKLTLSATDISDAATLIIKLFDDKGGTDKVAKSPAFQLEVRALADANRKGLQPAA